MVDKYNLEQIFMHSNKHFITQIVLYCTTERMNERMFHHIEARKRREKKNKQTS